MTIRRLGQLAGELRTVADVALFAGGAQGPAISSVKVKTGGFSYRGGATPFGVACSTEAVRGGFFVNHNGGLYSPPLVTFAVGATAVQVVWNVTAGQLELVAGYQVNSNARFVAAVAPAGALATPDQWRAVGFAYCCAAWDGFCSLYVDGVRVLHWAGDTRVFRAQQTTPEVAAIGGVYAVGHSGASSWGVYAYVDDFYVDDASGEADAPPPGRRFLFAPVDEAGDLAQWLPVGASANYACVDDAAPAAPDGDGSYVKALTAGLVDRYGLAAIALPADHAIAAAIPVAVARKTEAGVATGLRLLAHDGVNGAQGAVKGLGTEYGVVWERMEAQPDGSGWGTDAADLNGMLFGVESAGSF